MPTTTVAFPGDGNYEEEFQHYLERYCKESSEKKFSFLIVGRTGVGKSSTVNSLLGKQVAPVGDFEPETATVEPYETEIQGVKCLLYDTPGLCDSKIEDENDYKYLELIRSVIERVDSLWFITPLHETRVRSDEKHGIKLITQAFTSKIWEQSIIVFTFADYVDISRYSEYIQKRTELIRKEIASHTGSSIANDIPSVAVSNKSVTTPDGEKWLGELYARVISRMSDAGAIPFFLATVQRLKPPSEEKPSQLTVYEPSVSVESSTSSSYDTIELNIKQAAMVEMRVVSAVQAAVQVGAEGAAWGTVVGGAIGSVGGPVGTAIGAMAGFAAGAVIGAAAGFMRSLRWR